MQTLTTAFIALVLFGMFVWWSVMDVACVTSYAESPCDPAGYEVAAVR